METEVVPQIREIIKRARSRGQADSEIVDCFRENGYSYALGSTPKKTRKVIRCCQVLDLLIFKALPAMLLLLLLGYPAWQVSDGSVCLLRELSPFGEAVTPMVDCAICEGVTEAPRLFNLSQDDFIRNYAYTSKPILVVGAVSNWSALDVVSYDYFKSIYMDSLDSLEVDHDSGQFFAYGSNIRDLKDLFSLPSDVATMKTEKWYIGWSTSHPAISEALKKHISIPSFIPAVLSDISMSWIFMGSPGPGANIHIDMVGLSSWQAQLRGKKTWSLIPPPECEHKCHAFNVTMNTGDVLVVDTNKWFHQTYIHPGSISITIGAEYM